MARLAIFYGGPLDGREEMIPDATVDCLEMEVPPSVSEMLEGRDDPEHTVIERQVLVYRMTSSVGRTARFDFDPQSSGYERAV